MATKNTEDAKYTENVGVRLTKEQKASLDARAKATHESTGTFARSIILRFLSGNERAEDVKTPHTLGTSTGTVPVPTLPRKPSRELKQLKLVLKTAERCCEEVCRVRDLIQDATELDRASTKRLEERFQGPKVEGLISELRGDVIGAMRAMVLFVANAHLKEKKLSEDKLDAALSEAFPLQKPAQRQHG